MNQLDAQGESADQSAWRRAFDEQVSARFKIEDLPDTRVQAVIESNVPVASNPLLLVEDEDGFLRWVAPESTRGSGENARFRIDSASETRGVGGWIVRKALKILVPRAVDFAIGQTAKFVVSRWEQDHRAPQLRRFGPACAHLPSDHPLVCDLSAFTTEHDDQSTGATAEATADKPFLVLIPGIGATTASAFGQLAGVGLSRLARVYGERIIGFEHPTLSRGPTDSAAQLVGLLSQLADTIDGRTDVTIDVVGHDRGGLVARSLAELVHRNGGGRVALRRIHCVGTPHFGTPLADPKRLGDLLDQLTNLLALVPLGGLGEAIDGVLAVAQHLAVAAAESLPGLVAMKPGSAFLTGLADARLPSGASLSIVASDFEPTTDAPLTVKARNAIADRLLTRSNDLIVPYPSLEAQGPEASRLVANRFAFLPSDAVTHHDYFAQPATIDVILGKTPASRSSRHGARRTNTASALDETPFDVSVTHGSFERAKYHLMVGVYSGEAMSAPERFLNRQFSDLLAALQDADSYPDSLGASTFLESGREVPAGSYPTGAYLIGVGSTIQLDRRRLASTVRDALVDRCLRLYADPLAKEPQDHQVGVSSALLGVRNDDGLRIEDSVVGVIEAVRHANDALTRYESRRGLRQQVRITHLEFVERYSDRANTAAMAVRSAPAIAGLPSTFEGLTTVTVTPEEGRLPSSTSLVSADQSWRRFEITASDDTATDDDTVALTVASHDRRAQTDRATQRVDRASLDALVGRLEQNPGHLPTLRVLRDRLIPQALRSDFQTTSALQFLVDRVTANYPWELLAAPATSGVRAATGTGAVIRTFIETDEPRIRPSRADGLTALVIAAGKVDGQAQIDGVYAECDLVADALRRVRFGVEHRHDRDAPHDVADLNIGVFGNHRIVHIASHGEYVDGSVGKTGAILSKEFRLTTDDVSSFSWVPDLVFLNCCNLGQVGMHRAAAGLAREFMALGVRAFIAASWRVDDLGAQTFASTFYEEMGRGRSFGDAVTTARTRCAQMAGDHTWAAYQCYGDPGFVLSGSNKAAYRDFDPVSRSDAEARIETLQGKIADYSRPQSAQLIARREELVKEWRLLKSWVTSKVPKDEALHRLLAYVAQDLGEFDEAAELFGRFVKVDLKSGTCMLTEKSAAAADLERLANCTIRAVQRIARLDPGSQPSPELVSRARSARIAAVQAVAVHHGVESLGILAGLCKKWATIDVDHRSELLIESQALYRERRKVKATDRYGLENEVQIAALIAPANAVKIVREWERTKEVQAPLPSSIQQSRLTDQSPDDPDGFWGAADRGDRALTELMIFGRHPKAAKYAPEIHLDNMVEAYTKAFENRSTWSERSSVLDHLQDLYDLLDESDVRRTWLETALNRMQVWNGYEVLAEPGSIAATPTDPAPAGTVALTALSAACGDCLVLEYDGVKVGADQPVRHRMLIDGGLGKAYANGLGKYLATLPKKAKFDTVVVTHIDRDHIDGVIKGLQRHALRSDDFWFNGLPEITGLDSTSPDRGTRQGDQLDPLIPVAQRNRAWGGRAIMTAVDKVTTITLPGGAQCTLLGPAPQRLEKLRGHWPPPNPADEASVSRANDVIDAFDAFDAFDDTEAGQGRGPGSFGHDNSVANGSSIAFLFEHMGVSILFTGDAFAADLAAAIGAVLDARGAGKLAVDVFKLSHHGSRQNLTDALLQLIEPKSVLICTDGSKKFAHPDLDAIQKVRSHYPHIPIYFTDRTDVTESRSAAIDGVLPAGNEGVRLALP